jgi:hypothetical protein
MGNARARIVKEQLMSVAEQIVEKVGVLPPERQQEVLDFAEFLAHRYTTNEPRRSLLGLWADLGVDITEEDIEEVRREMWANFPREDIA